MAVAALVTAAASAQVPTVATGGVVPAIAPAEVTTGQRGYGLSVFQGAEPERFEVEVIGVIANTRPGTSYILAHLSGKGLEQSGVIAGMSGSPVYFDDRLAGAVAFSWDFAEGAIAGITPIGDMRALVELPPNTAPRPVVSLGLLGQSDARAVSTAERRNVSGDRSLGAALPATSAALGAGALDRGMGRLAAELLGLEQLPEPSPALAELLALTATARPAGMLEAALAALLPRPLAGTASGLAYATSGFAPATEQRLTRWLGSTTPSGSTLRSMPVVAGGAVAAVLVDGDFRLAATGTVTERQGDTLVAFGHPFLGLGPVRLPLASAEVVTVVPSLASSFKVSNIGPRIGIVDEDRQAGVRGRLGPTAPTVPVTVTITPAGGVATKFVLELADVPEVAPGLLAVSTYASLDAATHAGGTQELDLTARLDLGARGELLLEQTFDGPDAAYQAVVFLMAFGQYLNLNSFEKVDLTAVDIELAQVAAPRAAALVAGHAERSRVRPGETVRVSLELVPYRGRPFRETIDVTVPSNLPAGRYSLLVGDGTSIDAVRLQVATAPPENFDQALALLRGFHSRRELVAAGVLIEPGLAVAGAVMPRLPGSMLGLWKAAGSRSATNLPMAFKELAVRKLAVPVDGGVRIDLTVERRTPEVGEPSDAATAEGDADQGGEG